MKKHNQVYEINLPGQFMFWYELTRETPIQSKIGPEKLCKILIKKKIIEKVQLGFFKKYRVLNYEALKVILDDMRVNHWKY